jgi:hypothetical protein
MARLTTFLLAVSSTLSATAAADVTFPATVEVDFIFPRNETYTPTPVFPIVFAIQNLAAASPIGPLEISWTIMKDGSDQPLYAEHTVEDNTDSTDPHYVNLWTGGLDGAEAAGTYQLYWMVIFSRCLGQKDSVGGISDSRGNNFTFTIDPGAQQPNLSADLDACPAQNATIMIEESWPVDFKDSPRSSCGVVSRRDPPASPCAVKLDSAAASSIAAEVTASACAASPPALTDGCPESKDSSGSRAAVWSGLGMVTGPLLAGALLLVLQ